MRVLYPVMMAVLGGLIFTGRGNAMLTTFFSPDQTMTPGTPGVTSDTIYSNGYQFTSTMDKLWSPTPGGPPTGRFTVIHWPDGVQAQAVTTPPPGVTDYKARITINRVDGAVFDLTSFTAKLLANTSGAGGAIEVMPMLNGEDGLNDPVMFSASGFYGQTFYYDESTPGYLGNTTLLKNFDAYKLGLYVDFGLISLTLVDDSIAGDASGDGVVDSIDFGILISNYGVLSAATFAMGDFNFDGKVTTLDFNILAENFNSAPAVSPAQAPEPGTLSLLAIAGGAFVITRRPTPGRQVILNADKRR